MRNIQKYLIILIFLLSLALRLVNLENHPAFISDEASIGYNAFSILETGRDEWNQFLPLSFKSFGEYKLPVYIYSAVPAIAIFGLNEFSTRLPSAIFGSLTIILVYFLVKELFYNKFEKDAEIIGLLSCLFLAINPWHIQISRMAIEANVSLFLTLLGLFFLLKAKDKLIFYYPAFLTFALTFYTYNASRVFVPLFLIIYFFVKRKEEINKVIRPFLFFLMLLIPLFLGGFSGSGERLYKVGIFNDAGIINNINQQRGECQKTFPENICKGIYNKPVIYSLEIAKNYLSHFSPKFLFTSGAGLAQYSVPGQGMLYYWEFPFILAGLYWLLKTRPAFYLLLSWLLLAPIATSVTGQAHPVRSIYLLPIFQLLSAFGLYSVYKLLNNNKSKFVFKLIFPLILITSLSFFLYRYFLIYPQISNWNWQSGYKILFRELAFIEKDYKNVYITKFYGEPHIFYLFYNKYDPKSYQNGIDVKRFDREDKWVSVDQIGKYKFFQDTKDIFPDTDSLVAISPQENIFSGKIIKEINYKNNDVSFLILKNEK